MTIQTSTDIKLLDSPEELRNLANACMGLHGTTSNTHGNRVLWESMQALRRFAIKLEAEAMQPAQQLTDEEILAVGRKHFREGANTTSVTLRAFCDAVRDCAKLAQQPAQAAVPKYVENLPRPIIIDEFIELCAPDKDGAMMALKGSRPIAVPTHWKEALNDWMARQWQARTKPKS